MTQQPYFDIDAAAWTFGGRAGFNGSGNAREANEVTRYLEDAYVVTIAMPDTYYPVIKTVPAKFWKVSVNPTMD